MSCMKSIHTSLNTAHPGYNPSNFMSSFTHSLQAFLPLPTHLTPATTTFLQADNQSSPLLYAPNHLNLPRLTTSATLRIPNPEDYKSTLRLLSFNDNLPTHPSHHPIYLDTHSSPFLHSLTSSAIQTLVHGPCLRLHASRFL